MITSYVDILKQLEECPENKLFYFKNREYPTDAPPHYHICIPINHDEFVMLVFFTSQDEKRKMFYNTNPKALQALVEVNKDDFDFLTKENTLIDCNRPIYKTKEELASLVNGEFKVFDEIITEEFLTQIKNAIKKSPLVKKGYKKKIL